MDGKLTFKQVRLILTTIAFASPMIGCGSPPPAAPLTLDEVEVVEKPDAAEKMKPTPMSSPDEP